MKAEQMETVFLELKYCERCGGLWLRRKGDAQVHCESCLRCLEAASSGNEVAVPYTRLRRAVADDRRRYDFLVVSQQEGKA